MAPPQNNNLVTHRVLLQKLSTSKYMLPGSPWEVIVWMQLILMIYTTRKFQISSRSVNHYQLLSRDYLYLLYDCEIANVNLKLTINWPAVRQSLWRNMVLVSQLLLTISLNIGIHTYLFFVFFFFFSQWCLSCDSHATIKLKRAYYMT